MRVRIAPPDQASELYAFLSEHNYPHHWPEDWLARCLMFRIEDAGKVVGWVWMNWVDGADHILDVHVCVSPEARGRWLLSPVLADIEKVVELVGAKGVLLRPKDPRLVRGLRAFGFVDATPYVFKPIEQ